MVTKVVIRGWERASGQVVQYEGTLTNGVLRQQPPNQDDLEWLRNIGAVAASGEAVRVPFYDVDRETLREIGRVLDQIDALAAQDDADGILGVWRSPRMTYLAGYLAGLADREP